MAGMVGKGIMTLTWISLLLARTAASRWYAVAVPPALFNPQKSAVMMHTFRALGSTNCPPLSLVLAASCTSEDTSAFLFCRAYDLLTGLLCWPQEACHGHSRPTSNLFLNLMRYSVVFWMHPILHVLAQACRDYSRKNYDVIDRVPQVGYLWLSSVLGRR
jgi:hypothetical protein